MIDFAVDAVVEEELLSAADLSVKVVSDHHGVQKKVRYPTSDHFQGRDLSALPR